MPTKFVDVNTAAKILGVSPVRVRRLCRDGRVFGVERIGWGWLIPTPIVVLEVQDVDRKWQRKIKMTARSSELPVVQDHSMQRIKTEKEVQTREAPDSR